MATLVEVAQLARVSISTVSHVINDTRPVSPATRERVLAAVKTTGYRPNTVARSLRRAATDSIGLAVSDIGNPYFAEVIRGIEAEARAAGYTLLLANADDDPERELSVIRALSDRRVDGLIVSPTPDAQSRVMPYLARIGVPVVLVDRSSPGLHDQVLVENVASTRRLVEHLMDLGHTRIGMVAGIPGISTTDERVSGWVQAHQSSGLAVDRALIVNGGSQSEPARRALHDVMALPEPPRAIVVGNNSMTIGVMRGLSELGLRVPDDVALVAFDDFDWADLFQPRLTTMAQPSYEIGRMSVSLLLDRIAHPAAERRTLRLEPTFVHRESCGCPVGGGESDGGRLVVRA